MMAFDPGRRIDQERKTRGMAFGKSITREPLKLLETVLCEGLFIPTLKASRDKALFKVFDRALAAKSIQGAP